MLLIQPAVVIRWQAGSVSNHALMCAVVVVGSVVVEVVGRGGGSGSSRGGVAAWSREVIAVPRVRDVRASLDQQPWDQSEPDPRRIWLNRHAPCRDRRWPTSAQAWLIFTRAYRIDAGIVDSSRSGKKENPKQNTKAKGPGILLLLFLLPSPPSFSPLPLRLFEPSV